MKIFAYSYREFDEAEYFRNLQNSSGWNWGTRQRIRPWRTRIWRKGTST